MSNSLASFDSLSVCIKLEKVLKDVAVAELHLFTYLASLLSLYRKQPIADWGYQHTNTKVGAPYSHEVQTAIPQLVLSGFLSYTKDGFVVATIDGHEEYGFWVTLSQNRRRETFLEGACASVLALPVGIVRDAVLSEPELRSATAVDSTRTLLEGPGIELLYEQFAALNEAIGIEIESLMTPSVVWLTYLARTSDKLVASAAPEVSAGIVASF